MSESFKQNPAEVFSQRLAAVEAPDTFSGEKKEAAENQTQTDIEELNTHLSAIQSLLGSRETSPKFDESGKFLSSDILRDYFKATLFSGEYAPATIFRVLEQHIEPVLDIIFDYGREIKMLEESAVANGGAFSAILQDESADEDLPVEEKIATLKKKRDDTSNAMVLLMQRITTEPKEFGLVKKEDYNSKSVKMSVGEFSKNLSEKPYSELFIYEGVQPSIEAQKTLCKRYLNTIPHLKGDKNKEARDLLYKMCILPSLNRKYDIGRDEEFSQKQKNESLQIVDAEMGEFLHGVGDKATLYNYAYLIDYGELPEGVSIDELPTDFPVLREREPDALKREMNQIKNPQERAWYRLDHHKVRVERMDPSVVEERMQFLRDGDKKMAEQIFSTEVGVMPMYRILAFVQHVIKTAWGEEYKESMFLDFNAKFLTDMNKASYELMSEERKLSRNAEGYNQKYKTIKRKQVKLLEGLVENLSQWLDEDGKYTALLESSGASGGQLLLDDKTNE